MSPAPLLQLLVIACWPIAPLWFGAQRVRQLMEEACDEAVVGNANVSARKRYAEALLAVTQWEPRELVPAGELHFGFALKTRINALRFTRRWPAWAQAALIVVAIASIVAVANRRASAQSHGVVSAGTSRRPRGAGSFLQLAKDVQQRAASGRRHA